MKQVVAIYKRINGVTIRVQVANWAQYLKRINPTADHPGA